MTEARNYDKIEIWDDDLEPVINAVYLSLMKLSDNQRKRVLKKYAEKHKWEIE